MGAWIKKFITPITAAAYLIYALGVVALDSWVKNISAGYEAFVLYILNS